MINNSVKLFSSKDIYVSKPNEVLNKLKSFTKDDTHFVLDFDNTVTSYGSASTWQAVRNAGILPEEYNKKMSSLYAKYWPIERDESKSFEDRFMAMEEWHNQIFDFFYDYYLHERDFDTIGKQAVFREGFSELFSSDIPSLIISAGLTNVIEKYLWYIGLDSQNIQIISNHLKFNELGEYDGYHGNIIHAMNKVWIKKNILLSSIFEDRRNIVLMWDRMADLKMISDWELDDALKVGFLNTDSIDHQEIFIDWFDIVVKDDISDKWVIKTILQELDK